MPVGTYGTVKAMTPEELTGLGAQIVLGNTFHLMLRPGTDVIRAHGGLHGFMHWQGADPHGLGRLPGVQPRGAAQADRGGRALPLAGQRRCGVSQSRDLDGGADAHSNSDIVMAFDECPPYPATEAQARQSMELSMRWAGAAATRLRVLATRMRCSASCRVARTSACARSRLTSSRRIGFDGYAIGGLAVGEPAAERNHVLEALAPRACRATGRAT